MRPLLMSVQTYMGYTPQFCRYVLQCIFAWMRRIPLHADTPPLYSVCGRCIVNLETNFRLNAQGEMMTTTKIGTVGTTVWLMPEARRFLDEVAPGQSKGKYLSGLLLQEMVRRQERPLQRPSDNREADHE